MNNKKKTDDDYYWKIVSLRSDPFPKFIICDTESSALLPSFRVRQFLKKPYKIRRKNETK